MAMDRTHPHKGFEWDSQDMRRQKRPDLTCDLDLLPIKGSTDVQT